MAEGRPWEGEIQIHGAAEAHPCPICALPDLARAYEVAGKPDSAIATYERYLHTPWQRRYETDAIELGFAMKRLGELYQQQNDRAKAAAQYYPAAYWMSLLNVPDKSEFPGKGGASNFTANIRSQDHFLALMKTGDIFGSCMTCHQLGDKATREIPKELGTFANAPSRRCRIGSAAAARSSRLRLRCGSKRR